MRYHMNMSALRGVVCMACLLAMSLAPAMPACGAERQPADAALRIRIGGRVVFGEADLRRMTFSSDAAAVAAFRGNVVPLKRGEAVQLQVEVVDAHGGVTEVTKSTSVEYQSLAPWKLTVSREGMVTMTPGEALSPLNPGRSEVGDTAVLIGYANGESAAWNKIFFSSER